MVINLICLNFPANLKSLLIYIKSNILNEGNGEHISMSHQPNNLVQKKTATVAYPEIFVSGVHLLPKMGSCSGHSSVILYILNQPNFS